jgi:hypothetical protein
MAEHDALVALGVLSSIGASGQSNALQYLARRTQLRESSRRFANVGHTLQLRFLVATPPSKVGRVAAALEEQRRHNDIVFLTLNESRFTCALKVHQIPSISRPACNPVAYSRAGAVHVAAAAMV